MSEQHKQIGLIYLLAAEVGPAEARVKLSIDVLPLGSPVIRIHTLPVHCLDLHSALESCPF